MQTVSEMGAEQPPEFIDGFLYGVEVINKILETANNTGAITTEIKAQLDVLIDTGLDLIANEG